MNNQRPVWQRVLIFLFLAVVVIVAPWAWPGIIPPVLLSVSLFLGSYLLLEALAQPDPSVHNTPLYNLIGRYTNRRDRFVAGIALGVVILVILLSGILLGDMENINWITKFVLTLLLALSSYFAIVFYFGSQELRSAILPKILKRFLEERNKGTK